MTAEQFAYWLRGIYEVVDPVSLTPEQTKVIREHLDRVFTPAREQRAHGTIDTSGTLYC